MEYQTMEMPTRTMRLKWLRGLLRWPRKMARSRRLTLDAEFMSDYMKRDLGFVDGRGVRKDSDMTG